MTWKRINFIDRRKYIAAITIFVGLTIAVFSYWIVHPYFLTVLMNAAFLFIALGLGILTINLYLEYDKHRRIMSTIFSIIEPIFLKARKETLELIYAKYSSKSFVQIIDGFNKSNGNYDSLEPIDRTQIYEIVVINHEKIVGLFTILYEEVKEILTIASGSISDLELLDQLLSFQRNIIYFTKLNIEPAQQRPIVEKFLDCLIRAHEVHKAMDILEPKHFSKELEFGWILSKPSADQDAAAISH